MRPPPLSRAPSASSWSTSSSSSTESVDHSAQYPFIAFPHPIRSTPREADSPRSSYLVKDKESMTHSGQNEEAGSGYSFGFSRRHGPSRSWYGSRLLAELRGNWKPSNTVAFAVPESCFSSKTATVEQVLYSGPSESGINQMLRGWRTIVFGSWLNVLLIFIPISLIMNILKEGEHTAICIFCILSMIPLVRLHDLGTGDLALRIGGSRTGLLNASMSNIVELVVAVIALKKCELRVVQSTLIGAILSKLLLVLGICFFAGGLRFSEQFFDPTATQINCSLLSISVNAMLIPAAFHFASNAMNETTLNEQRRAIILMSRGVAVVLLIIYVGFIVFQLLSHSYLYQDIAKGRPSRKLSLRARESICMADSTVYYPDFPNKGPSFSSSIASESRDQGSDNTNSSDPNKTSDAYSSFLGQPSDSPRKAVPQSSPPGQRNGKRHPNIDQLQQRSQSVPPSNVPDLGPPQLSLPMNLALLLIVTTLVGVNVEWLVSSMDGISTAISKEWLALILLPAVSALAECITAINVSVKDQLTLAMSVAIGSTIQTALLIIPLVVLLGMVMGKPLALLFDPFESLVLYLGVTTMNYVVGDGKSNWMEGVILICLYVIIGVSFWFYPGSNFSSTLAACS